MNTPTGRKLASTHEIQITEEGLDLDKVMGTAEIAERAALFHQYMHLRREDGTEPPLYLIDPVALSMYRNRLGLPITRSQGWDKSGDIRD